MSFAASFVAFFTSETDSSTGPGAEWPYQIAMLLDEALPRDVLDQGSRVAATFLGGNAKE